MSQPSIVKNSLYKGLLNIFNMVIPIIVTPYIYRVLSPSAMGEYDYANTIYSYFNLFGLLGIVTYGIRELSRNRDDQEYVRKTYSALFSIGIISNLICFLIFAAFSYFAFHDNSSMFTLLIILSLNLISNFFNTEWINEAFEDFRFIAIKTAIIRLIYVVCIFIFIKSSEDIWIYALMVTISNFLNYIISFFYSRKYTKFSVFSFSFDWAMIKKVLPFLFFILLLENSGMLYTVLDRIMLGTYTTSDNVAYYSVSQRIMEIIRVLLATLTYVSLPRLSYYLGKDENLYTDYLNKLYTTNMMLSIPLVIGLSLISKDIVILFAGSKYTAASLPLIIFSIRIVTLMIESVTSQQVL
uniref:flippase n=1 Tax=Bacteroides sp. TaxID=29523 RepID=UPI0025B97B94